MPVRRQAGWCCRAAGWCPVRAGRLSDAVKHLGAWGEPRCFTSAGAVSLSGPMGSGGYCWCHLWSRLEASQGAVCRTVPFLRLGVSRQSPLAAFCQTSYQPEGGPRGLSAKKTRHCWVVAAASQGAMVTVPAPTAGAVMHHPVCELVKVNKLVWVLN